MGIINAKDESYGFPSKVEDGSVLSLVVSNDNTYNYVESSAIVLTRTQN